LFVHAVIPNLPIGRYPGPYLKNTFDLSDGSPCVIQATPTGRRSLFYDDDPK
jgi:hypothetical protein